MANPEISSKMELLPLLTFVLLVSILFSLLENRETNLFKKLKQHYHELITPSNLNTFLIPKTMSTFS